MTYINSTVAIFHRRAALFFDATMAALGGESDGFD